MQHNGGQLNGGAAPEFSRVIRADAVHRSPVTETIEATEAERHALAARLELESIDRLTATVTLKSARGGQMVQVNGTLEADVVQTCVVTLEPVPAHVSERFSALFAPEHLVEDFDEEEIDLEALLSDEDQPEPMENGRIDIGELTAQHLSLGLDPYPHAEGVEFAGYAEHEEGEAEAEAAEPEKPNPFAVLQSLKQKN
ncbi:DUF177 domain-containing protein [Azospirillum sp. SYSU D00513]|uniref:YceD family protein n=1 Tax=Azospirillum sp. SYSU D00513 TaxID=2812561 RepID=UPI001A9615EC|nr:DUF177 domain-containing protein [Azospirillum sp. SYSU D00513]